MSHFIACDDILNWAASYDGPKFHALLSDPPYELGFMGKQWDKSGIAFNPDLWRALSSHLLPGAFGMAFASTRGYHRMACAIEDAGLIIHPSIGWAFGSGFPKATRIDTQIDEAAGAERNTEWYDRYHDGGTRQNLGDCGQLFPTRGKNGNEREIPATPLARAWAGHRYGLQALKPAFEFICVFQKPYDGKPVDCITATGAGALWVDGSRIRHDEPQKMTERDNHHNTRAMDGGVKYGGLGFASPNPQGRWPANLILSHSPDCGETCVDGCAVKAMGEQSGESSEKRSVIIARNGKGTKGIYGDFGEILHNTPSYPGTGTAARYFYNADYTLERLENSDPFFYCAKASRGEREAGLDGRERKRNDFQSETSGLNQDRPGREGRNPATPARNHHATIKPLKLTQHLATLLLPPPEYAPRRLLVPFAGVASEMIGALLAGWDDVTGIEREAEYCEIGRARVKHWASVPVQKELFEVKK